MKGRPVPAGAARLGGRKRQFATVALAGEPPDREPSASMSPVSHNLVLSSGRRIHVADQGHGPPVVLVHGIPGSGSIWKQVADLLAPRHRVLVPDLLGFGGSSRSLDPALLHAAGQGAVLLEALDALDVRRAVLVGHDFGGPVSLAMWADRPERVSALGLLAANAFPDTPIPFPLSAVTWPLVGGLARAALFSSPSLRLMLRQGTGAPGVVVDAGSAVGDRGQARAIATIFEVSLLRLRELYEPIARALATVTVPTLVAWGDRDPFFPVEQGRRTARAVAGARFVVLDGAGHFLPAERPDQLAALISELVVAAAGHRGEGN